MTRWLADHLDCLAPHLGVRHLEVIGREVVIGERWSTPGRYGIEQTVAGLRLDLAARDEHGRLVIVEVQFGPADHKHVGQLITYANTADAALAVWVVADSDPVFCGDHLATLARVNTAFAGRPEFRVVAVTLESQGPLVARADVPWTPTLRGVDPAHAAVHRLFDRRPGVALTPGGGQQRGPGISAWRRRRGAVRRPRSYSPALRDVRGTVLGDDHQPPRQVRPPARP
ncbi:hypothetical protein [Kutzneria buriramensis]|uniref:hypothetical protein n=1 Tax=Kutzneria buriramensis TaxID=1045776 RepID=UPI0036D3F035